MHGITPVDLVIFSPSPDRESQEHEDAMTPETTDDQLPLAKVPLHPKDLINSKKNLAVRKERRRTEAKLRSMGGQMDYSPLPIDKHEPEFVSGSDLTR